jgi:hypothetical protein
VFDDVVYPRCIHKAGFSYKYCNIDAKKLIPRSNADDVNLTNKKTKKAKKIKDCLENQFITIVDNYLSVI